jgi:endo-1,4-beta-D-glucanase Y
MEKKLNVFFKKIYLNVIIFLAFFLPVFAGNYPFPINQNYAYGIRATGVNHDTIKSLYNTWKARYVTSSGCPSGTQRVQSPEAIQGYYNATCSEGQAYGMLLAVYLDDETLFDNLYKYKQNKSASKTPSHLMPWIIDSNGNIIDQNSASDADLDIAFALLMADKQWGSGGTLNYYNLALTEIDDIRNYDIATDNHLKPGDNWDNWEYPSYFMPAYFKVFREVDASHASKWDSVYSTCNTHIDTGRNDSNGLIGEILNTNGTARSDDPCSSSCDGRKYKYNSCRVPWRYAMEYVWNGVDPVNEVSLLANFFNNIGPSNVRDGYWVSSGAVEGSYHNAAFTGPAGCSLMRSSTYQTQLNNFYQETISFNVTESYYNGTLQLLTLLLMAGDFQNLRAMGTPQPTATPTPVPLGEMLDNFEDDNSQNLWGGYWYTYKADGAVQSTVWPAGGTTFTPSAPGAASTLYAGRITGYVAPQSGSYYPCVGMGTQMVEGEAGVRDVSGFTGIRFWVKGDGTSQYSVRFLPSSITNTGYNDYKFSFIPPATWTQIAIPFTDLTQEAGWGTPVSRTLVLQNLSKINWQTKDYGHNIDFWIDEIEFYPNLGWTPTPTKTNTPTNTYTFTASPTITPTFGSSELLDDCEDGDGINNWGGPWFTYDDSGNSGTSYVVPRPGSAFTMAAGGAASTAYAARITGYVTTDYAYGFIGMGTGTNPNSGSDKGLNCSGFLGIRFWAKGTATSFDIKLVAISSVKTGGDDYKFTFNVTNTWQQYQLFFSSFTQEGWGTAVNKTTVLQNLKNIQWQTRGQPWAYIELWVDQIEMFPSQGWTPTPTRTFTPSNTPTRTNTFTSTNTATFTRTFTITNTSTNTSTSTATNTPTNTATNTGTNTATSTRTNTLTSTITNTPTNTSSPTNTATNTGTNTVTNTRTNTLTNTATNTFTPTNTATNTPTITNTNTGTNTATSTRTWTITNTATDTATPTETVTGTQPPTWTYTNTPTNTVTNTLPATNTFTNTATNTFTPTSTATNTPTITNTNTGTNTATSTQTRTIANTATDTATPTDTVTGTQPPTWTNTETATNTQTTTNTQISTETASFTATNTIFNTQTPTDTPVIAFTNTLTNTQIPTQTWTQTGTNTATVSWTNTPSFTFTNTATNTYTQIMIPTNTQTPTMTSVPPTATPEEGQELKFDKSIPILVYPNPVMKDMNVKMVFGITKKASSVNIRIYSIAMRLIREIVYEGNLNQGKNEIILSNNYLQGLAKGTYYYVIFVKDKTGKEIKSSIEKIVIIK